LLREVLEIVTSLNLVWVGAIDRALRDRDRGDAPAVLAVTLWNIALPVGPSPDADTLTAQCTGSTWRRTKHGCPPGIAMTAPAPRGAGEEAEGRAGWGLQIYRSGG